jgi:hypothetical protein
VTSGVNIVGPQMTLMLLPPLVDVEWTDEAFVATPARVDPPSYCSIDGTDWTTPWWPTPGSLLAIGGDGVLRGEGLERVSGPWSGASARLGITGITRTQYGEPLPFATVRLFRTSTGELVMSVLSDGNGAYVISSQYTGAHFMTVHPTGVLSGTLAGASYDTLIPR